MKRVKEKVGWRQGKRVDRIVKEKNNKAKYITTLTACRGLVPELQTDG